MPAEYTAERIAQGVVLIWPGHATLTYTDVVAPTRVYARLHVHQWERPPDGPVGYEYVVTPTASGSRLTLRVGDFARVPDGTQFQEASAEFVRAAASTIQQLAESHR